MPQARPNSNPDSADWVLVLDQGGHATRALVFDGTGAERARTEVEIATQHPAPGRVEHDAGELLESTRSCLGEIAKGLGDEAGRIGGAALCTQRSSIVCWSRRGGVALSPVLSWQDVRAGHLLERLCPDPLAVHAVTGLRPSEHYGASKIRWCLDEIPAVPAALAGGDLAIAPLSSFLTHALSEGRTFAVDPCNASRTLLWDLRTRGWSETMLAAFGVPRSVLPECRPNRSDWLDLHLGPHRAPLCVVTGDQSAVPFAFDIKSGRTFLTLGTGAFLQQPERKISSRCEGLLNSVIFQEGHEVEYALEGTVNGASSALNWFAAGNDLDEAVLLRELPGWMAQASTPPLFLNAIGGLAAPFWRARARSRFEGEGDTAARAVAVVESIAFLVVANVEAMRNCGRRIEDIVAVGGLSRMEGLIARLAALAEVPVYRAASLEATAYGGARLVNPQLPPLGLEECVTNAGLDVESLRSRYSRWISEMSAF